MGRGQASVTAVEAAVGVLLLLSVTFTFALGSVDQPEDRAQLDAYAADALTVLETEQPSHGGATRLGELVDTSDSFEREKATLQRRVERILPPNAMYRLETRHGAVGYRRPDGVRTGTATTSTQAGSVTLRVWYA